MKIEFNVGRSTLQLVVYTVLVLGAAAAISFGITEWRTEASAADRLYENSRDSGLTPVFARATTRPCEDGRQGCVDLPIYDPNQATEEAKKAARWSTAFTVCILNSSKGIETIAQASATVTSCQTLANNSSGLTIP